MTRTAARSPSAPIVALVSALSVTAMAQHVTLPLTTRSTRFAVVGDTGTGDKPQYEIGRRLEEYRQRANFTFAIMVGDNIYGSERPQDFEKKFEMPYKPLLDAGVTFYAALGNHDDPNQRFYKPFNMQGERFYTFTKGKLAFFVLDSNYMDRKQLDWFERAIRESKSEWKMAYFHHPLYSSGATHGSETDLRTVLEPLFIKYGMDVVFAGHEHFYERVKPQKGVYYFTCGGSAKLRKGNIHKGSELTEKGDDTENTFMVVEVADDVFNFQTVSRGGVTVDSGAFHRPHR
jgi:predicted phosphodiesterase